MIGGWYRDGYGTSTYRTYGNMVLSAYPKSVAEAYGDVNAGGGVPKNSPYVVRDCANGTCAYYQYLQGTSMASPHATGVAALIVSEFGVSDGSGGLTMNPDDVAAILTGSATHHACPVPPTVDYTIVGRPASWNATCVGTAAFNTFWGQASWMS